MKSIPFPLMDDYDKTKAVSERLSDYSNFGTLLFTYGIEDCPKAYALAVKRWCESPKVDPLEAVVDWTAIEKAFRFRDVLAPGESSTQGYVVILLGQGRSGRTVGARWLSDARALLSLNKIVPAFISKAAFAEFGSFKGKSAAIVNNLRGTPQDLEDLDETDDRKSLSVLDGICDEDMTASETFALYAAIEACVDRNEFDLIITSSASSMSEFVERLSAGKTADSIVDRLNERAKAVEFNKSRVRKCPFLNKDGTPVDGYGSPEFSQKALDTRVFTAYMKKFDAENRKRKDAGLPPLPFVNPLGHKA